MTEEAIRERQGLLCTKCDLIELFLIIQRVPPEDREELSKRIIIKAFRLLHTLDNIDKMEVYLFILTENTVRRYFGYEEHLNEEGA